MFEQEADLYLGPEDAEPMECPACGLPLGPDKRCIADPAPESHQEVQRA